MNRLEPYRDEQSNIQLLRRRPDRPAFREDKRHYNGEHASATVCANR
jgi:hypothetical protein